MAGIEDKIEVSRRGLIKAAGTAALVAAVQDAFPSGAFAAGKGPEVKGAKLGFIAQTDAAPLNVAKELGLIANHGNPTGTFVPVSEIRSLQAGLPKHVVLVLDAAYAEYVRRNDY